MAVSACEFAKKQGQQAEPFVWPSPNGDGGLQFLPAIFAGLCLTGEWVVVRGVGKEAGPNSP